ncbi:MAG: conjugal transfer protein TraX, partial [Clostridiales bacterium]|nr:conjugal transfer protein TraX [Clostridiales bacterium]
MSSFILKLIAVMTMTIDHIGIIAQHTPYTSLGWAMRHVGRTAFVMYAFMIGEGCRNTRNKAKYLLRLLIFAVISELPFDFFTLNAGKPRFAPVEFIDFTHQNIFFTLFL